MSEIKNENQEKQYVQEEIHINREFKSSVFIKLFSDKKTLLSLYNALNKSDYKDESQLKINTIDDVVYMGFKNDVSFIIGSYMNLYEHQSTFCPNMPLRALLYFSRLYEAYIKVHGINIYGTKRLTLPTPRAIVFYNGTREYPDEKELKLSDSFQNGDGCMELAVTMLNINYGHNQKLLESCRELSEYSQFIDIIREYEKQGMPQKEAIDRACQYCIDNHILEEFLSKHRSEVIEVLLSTFDLDAHIKSENKIIAADTVREDLLKMMKSRLGSISPELREKIEQEENPDVLKRWFKEECDAAEKERDIAEKERDAAEKERDAAEKERDAAEKDRDAAEAEIARLRAVLAENGISLQ